MDYKTQTAKLLATENITVRHSLQAETASFDVKHRILTLPSWTVDDSVILDMMTGHEVGHALWTKMEDWEKALKELDLHKAITNIVEDARIEKKIKRRYPGLVKSFISGYRSLERKGFFYKSGEDVSDFNLIDRINLHFKLGHLRGIPFSSEEHFYVDMVDQCESWDDVVKCVLALMEYLVENGQTTGQSLDFTSNSNDIGTGSPLEDGGDTDMDDFGFGGDDSEDDSEEDDSEDTGQDFQNNNDKENGDTRSTSEKLDDMYGDLLGETQDNFDSAVKNDLVEQDKYNEEIYYFGLPDANLKNIIIPYTQVLDELPKINKKNLGTIQERYSDMVARYPNTEFPILNLDDGYMKFRRNSQKIVGYMAKEFERKKSAAEYRKESISKTGVLDMTKIHSYKYNDDLFLRNTIRPDGKNHGMIMLLDWSASMIPHLSDTIKQVISLVWFCQKVNVPFEVYAFTGGWSDPERSRQEGEDHKEWLSRLLKRYGNWNVKVNDARFSLTDNFKLLNLFSSRMSAKQSSLMAKVLFQMGEMATRERSHFGAYDLGNTPMLQALVSMVKIIPNFKEYHKIDVMNLITLTDGQGNNSFDCIYMLDEDGNESYTGRRFRKARLADPITRKEYNLENENSQYERYYHDGPTQERAVMHLLKDRYDLNIVGLFIDSESHGKSVRTRVLEDFIGHRYYNKEKFTEVRQGLRKNGVAEVPNWHYDQFFIVPVGKLRDTAEELEVDGTMTVSKIKNAFKKNQTIKFGNKVLVNKMMDIIA